MPSQHEEFDLDVRLQGMPAAKSLQADTEQEECNTRVSTCDATCDDANECAPDFSLAVTCNTCSPTCGGEGGTFCEETCGDVQTCPAHTCGVDCITDTCPDATCGCNTSETCSHVACPGIDTFPADACLEDTDGCGPEPPGGVTGDCDP